MVFGLPGISILAIYDGLLEHPIRIVTVRMEEAAGVMAEVYGRLTSRPGVCLTTAGPGATNLTTAIAEAYNSSSPLVHISGVETGGGRPGRFHGGEYPDFLRDLFTPITKWSVRVAAPNDIPRTLNQAFRVAVQGRPGPVHLEFPPELLDHEWEVAGRAEPESLSEVEASGIGGRDLSHLLEQLGRAARPLLYVDRHVLRTGAAQALLELVDALQVPVVATYPALSVLPHDHPLYAGFVFWFPGDGGAISYYASNSLVARLLSEADLILAVGGRPGTPELDLLPHLGAEVLLHIDLEAPTPTYSQEYGFRAGLYGPLPELLAALGERVVKGGFTHPGWVSKEAVSTVKRVESRRMAASEKGLNPGEVAHQLRRAAPRDTIFTIDVGLCGLWAMKHLHPYGPNTYQDAEGYGAMGFALPAATTAKLLHPDREVVALTGDGALLMALPEIATAVQERANIRVVVLNDARYSSIYRHQQTHYAGRTVASELTPVDFTGIARAMGAVGLRAEDPDELQEALETLMGVEAPALLDVRVDPDLEQPELEPFLTVKPGQVGGAPGGP